MSNRIRHIALTSEHPREAADFYRDNLGLEEVGTHPIGAVFLSDGHINLTLMPVKLEGDADAGKLGPGFSGIHHFGFQVEDNDEVTESLKANGVKILTDEYADQKAAGAYVEVKWEGPDGVVFDTSQGGWLGTNA